MLQDSQVFNSLYITRQQDTFTAIDNLAEA